LRVTELVEDLTVLLVDTEALIPFDPDLRSLMNVNRPEDYEALLRRYD
jgi:molybdopterin-guanine dinucleotide biosynthesis protein A